jgi:hypothetical protein
MAHGEGCVELRVEMVWDFFGRLWLGDLRTMGVIKEQMFRDRSSPCPNSRLRFVFCELARAMDNMVRCFTRCGFLGVVSSRHSW